MFHVKHRLQKVTRSQARLRSLKAGWSQSSESCLRVLRRPARRLASVRVRTRNLPLVSEGYGDVSRETSVAVFLFYFLDDSDRVGEEFHPSPSFWFRLANESGNLLVVASIDTCTIRVRSSLQDWPPRASNNDASRPRALASLWLNPAVPALTA
jgi:hypothetical protein